MLSTISKNVTRGIPRSAASFKSLAYSAGSRDTMLFNNDNRVEADPDRGPRLIMEQVLRLS